MKLHTLSGIPVTSPSNGLPPHMDNVIEMPPPPPPLTFDEQIGGLLALSFVKRIITMSEREHWDRATLLVLIDTIQTDPVTFGETARRVHAEAMRWVRPVTE